METCTFQTQMVSVMELWSKAAVAEINRVVDGNCRVLRLAITTSQRDIDALKKKCDLMEAELKRTRMRAKRRGVYSTAAGRDSPLVKVLLNKDRVTAAWDREMDELGHPAQCVDVEPASQDEPVLIKVEAEEDVWRNDAQEKLTRQPPRFEDKRATQSDGFLERRHPEERPADPGSPLPSPDSCDAFQEHQPDGNQDDAELLVEENTSLLGSDPQCVDVEPDNRAEPMLIKVEDVWRNDTQEKLTSVAGQPPCFEDTQATQTGGFLERRHPAERPADPGSLLPSTDSCDAFAEHPPNGNQNEAELLVKEEERENDTTLLGSDHQFIMEDADGRLWSSDPGDGDPKFCAAQQYEQIPAMFTSQSELPFSHCIPEDAGPPFHSAVRSHSAAVSKTRIKWRPRAFGYKRQSPSVHIPEEESGTFSQINAFGQSSLIPQPPQHQHQSRASAPHVKNESEDFLAPNPTASTYTAYSRSSLARRMRPPWRSAVGENRFSCTYCGKCFKRFGQLKEHLRSHTGEKPFSCLQCGRRFTKQCNLTRHAVVHSGEKPYECGQCGKCFTQSSSLRSHQKAAH